MPRAIVTGATSGIGRAIAVALAGVGHEVVAVGRDRKALAELGGVPGIRPVALDLSDRGALCDAVAGVEADILVNNAGLMPQLVPFCDAEQADLDAALSVNLGSAIALTRLVAPGMRERGRDHILFTGSTAGHAPFANLAVYCATKAGLSGFAQALRLDMAPHGVRVTEIVAGRTETGLYRDVLPAEARSALYEGGLAVRPESIAEMVLAVLALPPEANVARFDILPTRQSVPTGAQGTSR